MRWVVIFEDAPGMQAAREQHEADHLAYLRENQHEVLIAGELREGPGSPPAPRRHEADPQCL